MFALYLVWAIWGLSWAIAALWADRAIARPAAAREWRYRLFTVSGFLALLSFGAWPRGGSMAGMPSVLFAPLWHLPAPIEWALVLLALAGAGFAWWGRLHLGRLWSAALTRKQDHRVVDSGPYAIVRHPIYTGLIAAAVATLGIRGNPLCLTGFVLFVMGYVLKASEEERFLSAELGEHVYARYRAAVPMLIPCVRR
ncbi:Protein-S-isoprenylcysteine O-methyltransferase Ste14 [Sphingomonas sp. YR710]|uniref:methyltransferase family protein n=1 Tax=Sphingomonas sp. YR710 TaxID=1882773 RepID=UPI00087F9ADA|nr:isoprenylcysteine carboxylmethyltransferase family protein [Sphingomonas sp. YR710]SDD02368.1 Protein-S-isoprenylcysteine O-methyltransferase Ste14 [Sphingomonas sp. YR710]